MLTGRLGDNEFLAALPAASRQKLKRLADAQSSISAAFAEAAGRLAHARAELSHFESRLRSAEALPAMSPAFQGQLTRMTASEYEYRPPGAGRDAAVLAAKERVVKPLREGAEAARDEIARIDGLMQELKSKVSGLPHRLLQWGQQLDCTAPLEAYSGPRPKIPKGEPQQIVADLRSQIAALLDERSRVALAPLPRDLAKEVASRWAEGLAIKGQIDVSRCVATGDPPAWPMTTLPLHSGLGSSFPVVDAPSALAWLFRSELIKRLHHEIDLTGDNPEALDPQQRGLRQRDIDGELLELQRLEEAVIESAEADGHEILRRDTADGRAVLALSGSLPGQTP